MTEKFRVAVVTIWEVDAVSKSDASRKAEGAVEYAVRGMAQIPRTIDNGPRLRWRRYGDAHEATLVSSPLEADTALAAGQLRLTVADV